MEKGTHGINELPFEDLTYSDQARSLNAQLNIIEKALNAHFRKGRVENKDVDQSKELYKDRLDKIARSI